MPPRQAWLVFSTALKLLNGLKLAHNPTVCAGSHENHVVNGCMLVVDHLAGVNNLVVVLGQVMQLDDIPFGRVEHSFHFVALIEISRGQPVFLLMLYCLAQPVTGSADEQTVERPLGIGLQRQGKTTPGELVVAEKAAFGERFDGPGPRLAHAEDNLRCRSGGGAHRAQQDEQPNPRQASWPARWRPMDCSGDFPHSCPPRRISFPITTPEAADTTTGPLAKIRARATSCLMGASTVLVSFPFFAVNVTIVPSGTGLPEQSRTGSVSTITPRDVRWPLIRKRHGSDATCSTTLRPVTGLSEAVTCRAPADLPELVRNHATPSCVGTL